MEEFAAAGIKVISLSYDEQDALADFREAYDITYPLLSDPDSIVIREFGILNTLIGEDEHPWFGIPFPGAYVIDSEGLITHKFFENNLAIRVGPEILLRASQGETVEMVGAEREAPEETIWNVRLDGDRLAPSLIKDLVARIDVPKGRHLYADPAPESNVPVALILDHNPQIVTKDLVKPDSHSLTLAGTGEVIEVYEGAVEIRLPITVNTNLGEATTEPQQITIEGDLAWQTCDDEVCDLPRRERFSVTVPLASMLPSEINGAADGEMVRPMNGVKHFEQMAARREK